MSGQRPTDSDSVPSEPLSPLRLNEAAGGGALADLLESGGGSPREVLYRVLQLACEITEMASAFVSVLDESGGRIVRFAVASDGRVMQDLHGRNDSLKDAWCGRILSDETLLVPDAQADPDLYCRPVTEEFEIGSSVGVLLYQPDGTPLGTLCAIDSETRPDLNERDGRVLQRLGRVAEKALGAYVRGDEQFDTRALTPLIKPILEALRNITGMASVYLTTIDFIAGEQTIIASLNSGSEFAIPEGLSVPWSDTLCKRALDEGQPFSADVPQRWPDSDAARSLGIATYLSVPVKDGHGRLWGTLCCADARPLEEAASYQRELETFSRLISAELGRNQRQAVERDAMQRDLLEAGRDSLTGCALRQAIAPWMDTQLAHLQPGLALAVVFIDLDGLKVINDRLGHAAGDAVIAAVGQRLQRLVQSPDTLAARYGGDEFIVAAVGVAGFGEGLAGRVQNDLSFEISWQDKTLKVSASVGVAEATSGSTTDLIMAADLRMYRGKQARGDGSP